MLKKVITLLLFLTLLITFVVFRSSLEAEDQETSAPDKNTLEDNSIKKGDTTTENSEEELKSIEDKIEKDKFRFSTSKSMKPINKEDYKHFLLKRQKELEKTEKK